MGRLSLWTGLFDATREKTPEEKIGMPKKRGFYFIVTIKQGGKVRKERFGGSGLFPTKSEKWIRGEIKDWVRRVGRYKKGRFYGKYKGAKVTALKKVVPRLRRK